MTADKKINIRRFVIIFLLLCMLHFFFWLLPKSPLNTVLDSATKSLPILWLLWGVCKSSQRTGLVIAALIFSFLGDMAAEITALGSYAFLSQIGFFAIAQLCYLLSFQKYFSLRRKSGELSDRLAVICFFVVFAGYMAMTILSGMVAKDTSMPISIAVIIYFGLISFMAISAIGQRRKHYMYFVAGAMLFVFSDSIIAMHAFVSPVPGRGWWVMTTYYAAQFLLNLAIIKEEDGDLKLVAAN